MKNKRLFVICFAAVMVLAIAAALPLFFIGVKNIRFTKIAGIYAGRTFRKDRQADWLLEIKDSGEVNYSLYSQDVQATWSGKGSFDGSILTLVQKHGTFRFKQDGEDFLGLPDSGSATNTIKLGKQKMTIIEGTMEREMVLGFGTPGQFRASSPVDHLTAKDGKIYSVQRMPWCIETNNPTEVGVIKLGYAGQYRCKGFLHDDVLDAYEIQKLK